MYLGKISFFKVPLGGIHLKRFSFCLELQIWYLLLLFFPAGLVSAGFGKPISLHVRINK